ncbi:MAG: winged helix-turn-helix domain-containing protein [Vicinamibacteria bacterium]|nr:winged helix-turn-helix domain-containing protein [Vicinamibacteria bacterium]
MSDTGFSGHGYQFGVFDLDTKTGELRKEGRLVHLRNQPFQVLSLLLRRVGDLVTREEIKAALWADNADVDVEQGLNYCIKELRSALGDNADAPRFIQTLPRRGYRFLADVRRVGVELPSVGSAAPSAGEVVPDAKGPLTRTAPPSVETVLAGARERPKRWLVRLTVAGVLLLAVTVLVVSLGRKAPEVPTRASTLERLVVLPFNDLSATSPSYLADGLTEELIGSLGRVTQGRLAVIARSSSLAYRNRPHDAPAFARELGASYFIEGTVRQEASTVRVTVSLARAADGTQVWSETYDRHIGDLLALEREVVRAIGSGIRVAVNTQAIGGGTADPDAYLEYLKGRFEWNKRSRESLLESQRIFESITTKNPTFALGWAGLADAYAVRMDQGHVSAKDAWLKARIAAETAVSLDPGLAEAWTNLGMIRGLYEWNFRAAEEAFERAAAIDPNYSTRLHWQSILLRSEGRYQEGFENLKKARDLDPLSLAIRVNLSGVLLDLGREQEALVEAESIVSLTPDWGPGQLLMGDVLERVHRMDEAEQAYRKAVAAGSTPAKAELAAFYLRRHQPGLAKKMLSELQEQSRTSYVSPYLIAVASAGLDPEAAFRALEAAFEERSPALRLLRRDPRFDTIRGDPRFERLMRVLWPAPGR